MWLIGIPFFALYFLVFGVLFIGVLTPELYLTIAFAQLIGWRGKPSYQAYMSRFGLRWAWTMTQILPLLGLRLRRRSWPSGSETERILSTPHIFFSNHQSSLDALVFPAQLYSPGVRNVRWIVKDALRRGFVLGRVWTEGGCAFVHRDGRESDLHAVEALGARACAEGAGVALFPQGTRAKAGEAKPPKTGGFVAFVRNMPRASLVPFTFAFDAPIDGGRNMWQGSAFFGRILYVDGRVCPPVPEEAAAEWLKAEFVRMQDHLRKTGAA